jgi:hypothetical protein
MWHFNYINKFSVIHELRAKTFLNKSKLPLNWILKPFDDNISSLQHY